ncbi:MAG: glutamate--tRNA ligase [Clostridiales bacterium]|jgi:nondiscriminating glutamyl-tRNA synthetase|nr:glutamate--tRNA ligase [Clostridiales bacterium]
MARARFAPSPTGPIHIGNMRTALFNHLFVESGSNNTMILRIEDTDLQRSSAEYERLIYEELNWLGIEWDEGPDKGGDYKPYRQSERLDIYNKYYNRLIEEGKAYYCFCTPGELERDKNQTACEASSPRYSGRCRRLTGAQAEEYLREGKPATIRFKIDPGRTVVFEDVIKGRIEINSDTLGGDMVIRKSDGMPTYNFSATIDDHLMGITHVIRGEDHLSNTPKQILLYDAFGWVPPAFAHAPLILGPDRTKLSKRHGNTYIGQYRQEGYLPEAMLNYLALLSWAPEGERELLSKEEIIKQFRLERVTRANPVFDIDKLNWINAHYIKEAETARITELAMPYLIKEGLISPQEAEEKREWLELMTAIVQDSLVKVSDITDRVRIFFNDRFEPESQEALQTLKAQGTAEMLKRLKSAIEGARQVDQEFCSGIFKALQKETGIKGKHLYMPIRVAVTGQCHGPELVKIFSLLGKERLIDRIDHVLNNYV